MSVGQMQTSKCMEWCTDVPTRGQSRKSPVFILENHEYFFEFILDGSYDYTIYLRGERKKLNKQKLQVKFQVLDKNGVSILDSSIIDLKRTNWLWFIETDSLNEKMRSLSVSDDCVTFLFFFNDEFEPYLKTDDKKTNEKSIQTSSYAIGNLLKDFSKLLDEGPGYDVEFTCEDQIIGAHKNILCCRSSVFASMLQSDMVEGKTGKVNIKDMNADLFRKFLGWLYTGNLPEVSVDTAVEFYRASDKYALGSLRNQCVDFLMDNLSCENACEILLLADKHSDTKLKESVLNYIFKEKIPMQGENWTDFCNENQKLAIEVLNLFCQYQHKSYN